jgi:hypothetical protein
MRPSSVSFKTLLALAAVVLALAASGPALAQQAPSLGSPDQTTSTSVPPETTATTSGDGGLKTWQEALIFTAGLALLAGIGFAILGDARERAANLPRSQYEADDGTHHHHSQRAKQRARAKARAAKRQRRRNRA